MSEDGFDFVVADLQSVGYEFRSVDELRNSGVRYVDAIPVLLYWLPRMSTPKEKQFIVRALSVPWAKPAAVEPLLAQFEAEPAPSTPQEEHLRWAVGNALCVLWDDRQFERLAALITQPRFGTARQMLVLGLGKSKRPEVVTLLLSLMDDRDVNGHAVDVLSKLRAPQSRQALEDKLTDDRAWVRKAAKRGLERLSPGLPDRT